MLNGTQFIMELPNKFDVILNTDSPNSAEQVEFIEVQYIYALAKVPIQRAMP